MKRYGNLYQKVYAYPNIQLAHQNARKGKTHYQEVQMIDRAPDKYLYAIRSMLRQKTFRNSDYEVFEKQSNGKCREISKLPYYPDRIIHHAIMNVVKPIWNKLFIRDTYSAIECRGIHDGVRRIQKALQDDSQTQYCLKADIVKFYPSIAHKILKKIIRKKIKDPELLWLLDTIIDSTEGVPIGNYLSQYFGNVYLTYFDHWIKENLRMKYYFRYCDDLVLLERNKSRLHIVRQKIATYLQQRLQLQLKDNWQIFPVDARGIDFLGYVFFHGYTQLRKSIKQRFCKKIRRIKQQWKQMDSQAIVNGIMSYWGWLKHCDGKHLWDTYIDQEITDIMDCACNQLGIRNPLYSL